MAGEIALSDVVRLERVTRGRGGVRSFVTAKNYAEMVVALNGADPNRYPFFGKGRFSNAASNLLVIGSLTTVRRFVPCNARSYNGSLWGPVRSCLARAERRRRRELKTRIGGPLFAAQKPGERFVSQRFTRDLIELLPWEFLS